MKLSLQAPLRRVPLPVGEMVMCGALLWMIGFAVGWMLSPRLMCWFV